MFFFTRSQFWPSPSTSVLRKASPGALNTSNGTLQELNIGVAEAIIQNGEIKSFNILQKSNGLPSTDALLSMAKKLLLNPVQFTDIKKQEKLNLKIFVHL